MLNTISDLSTFLGNAVFFGPCVRSFIGGEKFISTDIASLQAPKDDMIRDAKHNNYTITKGKTFKATTYRRHEYTFSKDGNNYLVNFYTPTEDNFTLNDVIKARYSADINRLSYTQNNEIKYVEPGQALEVIRKLRNRKFKVMDDGFSQSELDELLSVGFNREFVKINENPTNNYSYGQSPSVNKYSVMSSCAPNVQKQVFTNSFLNTLKTDTTSAAYRIASTQITAATKKGILLVLEKQGHNSERISAFAELLDTEFGAAFVSLIIGYGLTYAPKISEDQKVQRLAGEFRIEGMTTIGNAVIETAIQHFAPVIINALSSIPKEETSIRVKEEQEEQEEQEQEQEEDKIEEKQMKA